MFWIWSDDTALEESAADNWLKRRRVSVGPGTGTKNLGSGSSTFFLLLLAAESSAKQAGSYRDSQSHCVAICG